MDKIRDSRGLTIKYAALQGNYWMAFGAVFSFVSVYLLAKGFTAGAIGMLLALGNIAAAAIQPVIAAAADKSGRVTLKDMMLGITAAGVIPAAALIAAPSSKWLTAVLFMAVMFAVSVQQPLINSVNGYYSNRGYAMNFGLARGAGSLAFAVITWLMGYLAAAFGEDVIPVVICVLLITMAAVVSAFRMERGSRAVRVETGKYESKRVAGLIKKYKKFFLVLLGIMLLFVFHNMVNTYLIQIMGRFGGNSRDMGTSLSIAAVCEIPVMLLFSKIVRKIRPDRLIQIAGLGFLVKSAVIWMAGSVFMVHMSQLLQACSFAVLVPASVYYSDEVMEEGDRVKGQAFLTVSITLGGILGNFLGGKLIDAAGVMAMLTAGAACAAAGMLFAWAGTVSRNERKKDDTV